MLLNLLVKVTPRKITIAGFDGFDSETEANYLDGSFQNDRHAPDFDILNREIKEMLREVIEKLDGKSQVRFFTSSLYSDLEGNS